MWLVQSYTRPGTDGRETKCVHPTAIIVLLPCTSTQRGRVRLHASNVDLGLSPAPAQELKDTRICAFLKQARG